MRMVRTVASTFAGLMFVPAVAFAQVNTAAPAPSRDAWYWGINGGAMMFNAGYDSEKAVTAPSVGAEWFIMRQRFALRISVQQAFFEEQSAVYDPTVPGAARPGRCGGRRSAATEPRNRATPGAKFSAVMRRWLPKPLSRKEFCDDRDLRARST